ncbi:hypothetical protein ACTS9K_08080 [Empedobacter sp. ULE_I145]
MKRLLLILCVLGFANLSQAQTKEETIAWIKEKLEKYGGWNDNISIATFIDVNVSPCKISFMQTNSEVEGKRKSFNPSHAKSWGVNIEKTNIFADANIIDMDDGRAVNNLFLQNGESNIHERMIKALLHLATFCEETKNEAF